MKRILIVVMVLSMIAGLTLIIGCGEKSTTETGEETTGETSPVYEETYEETTTGGGAPTKTALVGTYECGEEFIKLNSDGTYEMKYALGSFESPKDYSGSWNIASWEGDYIVELYVSPSEPWGFICGDGYLVEVANNRQFMKQ